MNVGTLCPLVQTVTAKSKANPCKIILNFFLF